MSPLDAERARRADALLEVLLDLSPGERRTRLDALRVDDAELAALVVRLLRAADEDATGPLEAVADLARAQAQPRGVDTELTPGTEIGAWRIVEPLAQGGMSRVYVAERTTGGFLQRAALKQFRSGGDWNESLARRFEQERQLLAALEDPDIARVLDGGVGPDGRPFLVMELVDGEPIDEHCARFGLALRDRIALVQRTARAVQHAHRHLVVHRDIKPSNILVTAQGAVKLLDFGIAKVLEGSLALGGLPLEAPQTRTTARPLTPAYASPEQVRGTPITTASDVYQLGLLAYELIDGEPAHRFQNGSLREFERVVCEADPPRLGGRPARLTGTLERRARVPPDLETVIFKALAKDPERRYASAEQFAEDLGRYLGDQPVLARRDTAWYRARKFVRRHRVATIAVGAIGAIVIAATVALAALSRRLASERDRAQLEVRKAEEVTQFLVGLFEANDPERSLGETLTARDLLDRGAARLERDAALDPRLRVAMELNVAEMNLQLERGAVAEPIARRALAGARGLPGEAPAMQAQALHLLSWAAVERGDYAEAESQAREALAIATRELAPGDRRFAVLHAALGSALQNLDRPAESAAEYAAAAEIHRRYPRTDTALALTLSGLGVARLDLGDLAGAETVTRESLKLLVEAYGAEDLRTAWTRNNLGRVLERKGDLVEARALYESSLAMRRRLYGEQHASTAVAVHNLARLVGSAGDWDSAVRLNREAYDIRARTLGEDHPVTNLSLLNLGIAERERENYPSALELLSKAADRFARKLGEDHRYYISARIYSGLVLMDLGRTGEAAAISQLAERELLAPASREQAPAAILLGRIARERGDLPGAISHFERALAAGRALGEPRYRPTLEAAYLLAQVQEPGTLGGGNARSTTAAAIRELSPRLRSLAESGGAASSAASRR